MNNYVHYKVWDEIIYPFPNFNSAAVEVWECIYYFISHWWACDYLSMLGLNVIHTGPLIEGVGYLDIYILSCKYMFVRML